VNLKFLLPKKGSWLLSLIISFVILMIITSCEKFPFDYRNKYVGLWTFEVTRSHSIPLHSTSSVDYYEGSIFYGAGHNELLIRYSSNTDILKVSLDLDGSIGNLPGEYNYGKFEGKDKLNISYGHRGNYSDLTYIYGQKGSFLNKPPVAATDFANPLTYGAYLCGTVNANSLLSDVTFEYGLTDSYGETVNAIQNPIGGFKFNIVGADISGLAPGTLYHFRINISNSLGTMNGKDLTVKTNALTEPVGDIDGNTYQTVTIGKQVWMAENLKVTKFNDGSSIPLVVDNDLWGKTKIPRYCFYNNDTAYKNVYGSLYNWYAVKTNKLCPTGWHVPTLQEWTTLEDYSPSGNIGGILKEAGTTHWLSPNTGATNSSGFRALPSGNRDIDGPFYNIGSIGYWWSSTEDEMGGYAWTHYMFYNNDDYMKLHLNNTFGFSVRCIRDN
jgi:uncharacterized protein (TIGR02145 family)